MYNIKPDNSPPPYETVNTEPIPPQTAPINPEPISFIHTHHELPQNIILAEEDVVKAYNISRTIKLFAIIDCILCGLNAIYYWPFLILILLTFMGYYGAKTYNTIYIAGYILYNLLQLILRSVTIIYYNLSVFEFVIFTLTIIITIWILELNIKFIRIINNMIPENLALLRRDYIPSEQYIILF
jgi:hypothetical protein